MKREDPVRALKGVGPKKAEAFEKLGIFRMEDFLSYYPRAYEDRSCIRPIASLREGEKALIRGRIALLTKGGFRPGRRGRGRTLHLLIEDESGAGLEAVFFNAAYFEKTLNKTDLYEFYGEVTARGGRLQMVHPSFSKAEAGEGAPGILPVYPTATGLTQKDIRNGVKQALALLAEEPAEEFLPESAVGLRRLCGPAYALKNIHFPENTEKLKAARYRLVYEELFLLETALLSIRSRLDRQKEGIAFPKEVSFQPYIDSLPFALTGAQKRVLEEVEADMEGKRPMNRLVQGDVGSGKTAVAAAAIYKAVKSGYQAVLMAPTELLATQHYEGMQREFAPLGISVGLLTGSRKAAEQREILGAAKEGSLQLLIGTHALIQERVEFANLGLVITDEQHRFGVRQRSLLSSKGKDPDTLVMTATPIPRTLAIILYGDLDISRIDELPPGRKPILTRALSEEERDEAYRLLRQEIREGRQGYVVAPLIADSEGIEARSAEGLYEEIAERFPEAEVALLHGGMKSAEKDRIMAAFYKGEVQILVSTVVIEVGINVPNATVMLIESAQRFGLAQLHQLRGRVGRGSARSYCLLITQGTAEYALERAKIMAECSSGFDIAEQDLALRGPGEVFGLRQHGMPQFQLADPVKHSKVLYAAREDAERLLKTDPELAAPENRRLNLRLQNTFAAIDDPTL